MKQMISDILFSIAVFWVCIPMGVLLVGMIYLALAGNWLLGLFLLWVFGLVALVLGALFFNNAL